MTDAKAHLTDAHKAKDDLLSNLRTALDDAGLRSFDIASLHVRRRDPGAKKCPDGKDAEWEAVADTDGSVTFRWVCR